MPTVYALDPSEDFADFVFASAKDRHLVDHLIGSTSGMPWTEASIAPRKERRKSRPVSALSFLELLTPIVDGPARDVIEALAPGATFLLLRFGGEERFALSSPPQTGLLDHPMTELVRAFPSGPFLQIVRWRLSTETSVPALFRFAERRAGPFYVSEQIRAALDRAGCAGWMFTPQDFTFV